MRLFLLVLLAVGFAAGCATGSVNEGLTRYTLFDTIELALPSDLTRIPAQGVDSEVAHFQRSGLHLSVSYGSEVPQLQPDAFERETFTAPGGHVFDSARVRDRMEGYPHGLWMVQRVPANPANTRISNDRRVGIFVHCVAWAACQEVAASARRSLRIR